MFGKQDLDELITAEVDPAVSAYLSTHRAGRSIREDPIRLDQLLQEAKARLRERGTTEADIDALLDPARALVADGTAWRHQDRGLALFLGTGFARIHPLPIEVSEEVRVAHRFHVTPLLPLLADDRRFHIVALSAARARLFEATRWSIREIDAGLPQGVATIAEATDYQQTAHAQPQGRPQGRKSGEVPSAQNLGTSPEDLRKAQLLQYLNKVATLLERRFSGLREPILVAAQDEVAGNFRKNVSHLPSLMGEHLSCNPDAFAPEDLHERAWPLVQRVLPDPPAEAVEHFEALFNGGDGRATVEPGEIVKGARYGRVDTLLVADGARLWGHYAEDADAVVAHAEPEDQDDEDLINYAAVHTLRSGGAVRLVSAGRLPGKAAAIMRYGYDPGAPFEKRPG